MLHPLITLLMATMATTLQAQDTSSTPRLVVGITVDQLRSDLLEAFAPLYGEDGLKRLIREGVVYANAQYPSAGVDAASAVATVYTGTVPYNHGIVGTDWMDRASMRAVYCVDDFKVKGVGTRERTSPQNLLTSTIGDELKLATSGRGIVCSLAGSRETAVLSAGHAADWAAWIDDETGSWAGTTYYGETPAWFRYLESRSVSQVQKWEWKPTNDAVAAYNYYMPSLPKSAFAHVLSGAQRFRTFRTSGLVNEVMTDAASSVVKQAGMGADETTDFLALTYTAGLPRGMAMQAHLAEMQDTYVRLDAAVAKLLQELDRMVGLDHVLVFLTSTGHVNEEDVDLAKFRIPTSEFKINRCAALLNMYLMAIYGQGQYVESYYGNELYLNHKLIEQKQLNLTEIQETSEDFLFQYAGVRDVYTSNRLTQGAWTPGISRIRNGYNPKCSGDIQVQVNAGWTLVNEDLGRSQLVRDSYFEFPLIFFGYGLQATKVATPMTVDCIAPTLARFMRIRAPNACSSAPLPEVRR